MNRHHKRAIAVICTAVTFDAIAGLAFGAVEHISIWLGEYWAVATATTIGYGDITPRTGLGQALAVVVMLTVVPLFSATFSLFTSGLTASRIEQSEARMKDHLEQRLAHHLGERDKDHHGSEFRS